MSTFQSVGGGGFGTQAEGTAGGGVNGFESVTPLNKPRSSFAAATDGSGNVYAIGGLDRDGNRLASVEKYDASADSWSTVASLNTGRVAPAAASDGSGNVYAIGGLSSGRGTVASVEKYDASADSWSTVASLSTERRRAAAASDGSGNVYAISGLDSGNNELASVEKYDASADSWSFVASLSTARRNAAAASDDTGSIYAIGGQDSSGDKLGVQKSVPVLNTAYSASGDALVALIASDGRLRNAATGVKKGTDEILAVRSGETIEYASSDPQARVIQIGGD